MHTVALIGVSLINVQIQNSSILNGRKESFMKHLYAHSIFITANKITDMSSQWMCKMCSNHSYKFNFYWSVLWCNSC